VCRLRIRKPGEQGGEPFCQLFEFFGAQTSHRALQRADGASGRSSKHLLAVKRGMDLHAALIAFIPPTLDPSTCDQPLQHVAHRGALHSESRGQMRSGDSRIFADTCQRTVHRNRCIGHALELSIERTHAIDE